MGAVLETGRGSLPFALVHGEPLVACAAWALGAAGVEAVDLGTPWEALVEDGRCLVLHDALCPLTPPAFVVECVEQAEAHGAVVVGVRPVTDTVKALVATPAGDDLGETVDRTSLRQVVSPVVLPPVVVASLDGLPTTDLPRLATELAQRFPVAVREAPAEARRVAGLDDVRLLEALTAAPRRPRRPPGT
ncbi:2-C-methyl-D-erythritol 4-phosphate cytidylyltransferase [Nocardioides flavescens]|uniref:2-C-methyl-D-erythritol 4-phosphate cytidylyltransferase n=1 Tax=Nocardioides flavescens TaxID=2691959 RepID=UPI001EEE7526|nr:2-C-methyl-D-erythritol 4-phosphate cytidylyltransferase [Nocardioides flavescens]